MMTHAVGITKTGATTRFFAPGSGILASKIRDGRPPLAHEP